MTASPLPTTGQVHIYCLTLPQNPSEVSYYERFLSAPETARACSLKIHQVRNRFIAGRGLLREILGGYLAIEPENVPITIEEHGKPFLSGCTENLRFNLSHAEELLLLAVAADLEIGIDIEKIETDKPLKDMASIAMSRREQDEIFILSSSSLQAAAFYRCWVRKEACLKACGKGFSLSSDSFDVSPLDEDFHMRTIKCNNACWNIIDINVPQGFCAALAVEARASSPLLPTPVRIAHRLSYS